MSGSGLCALISVARSACCPTFTRPGIAPLLTHDSISARSACMHPIPIQIARDDCLTPIHRKAETLLALMFALINLTLGPDLAALIEGS